LGGVSARDGPADSHDDAQRDIDVTLTKLLADRVCAQLGFRGSPGAWGEHNVEEELMANPIIFELQAVAGGLHLAKRGLDDVLAKVTSNPGPIQDPAAVAALTDIVATSQAITAEAQQIQALPGSAPPVGTSSSIEVKKDVQYLGAAARARIAEETMGIKLATYKYKTDADGAREHLGFILEDSPNVPAADMGRKEVDLYAYASMVLATVQQQQQEITTLRAEVERLKKS
jgi:hypothetical protein